MILRHTLIVDASHNPETNVIEIGIAVHETDKITKGRNGILIDQISESYQGIQSGHGEMLALFRALEIAKDREYKNVRLRSDYNTMRKALKKSYEEQTEFERIGLYGEVMRITRNFDSVNFGYKPRRKKSNGTWPCPFRCKRDRTSQGHTFDKHMQPKRREANKAIQPTAHAVSVCVNVVPPFYHANGLRMHCGRWRRYVKKGVSVVS